MWPLVMMFIVLLVLGTLLILRRRRAPSTPFGALSREDQVQALRHHQDGDALRGGRDSSAPVRFDGLGPGTSV